jgi:hypothetical protein
MRQIKNKTRKMLEIERVKNTPIEELLRRMYVDESLSAHAISNSLNISYLTCLKWLSNANITSRRIVFDEGNC